MAQVKTQVTATRNPSDGEKAIGYWEILDYAHDATDPVVRFSASATNPVLVKEVVHVVRTAFTATATLDVGDGSDADYWIDQNDITVNSAGNTVSSFLASNATAKSGRLYVADGEVKVTVGGVHAAGVGTLMVHLVRL